MQTHDNWSVWPDLKAMGSRAGAQGAQMWAPCRHGQLLPAGGETFGGQIEAESLAPAVRFQAAQPGYPSDRDLPLIQLP